MTQVDYTIDTTEFDQANAIDWDDLTPECEYLDREGCEVVAKWAVSGKCCGERTRLCCTPHSQRDFYCNVCGNQHLPVKRIPL